jgi:hypothetical protein
MDSRSSFVCLFVKLDKFHCVDGWSYTLASRASQYPIRRAEYPIRSLACPRAELELGFAQEIILGEPSQAGDFKPVSSS